MIALPWNIYKQINSQVQKKQQKHPLTFKIQLFQIRMVLKGIPSILSPELLHALASMGHGDKIVLADANFPSSSICSGDESPRLIRADGHSIPQLLQAILTLLPLDTYTFAPVST